jgi:hypothetical protein
VYSRSATAWEEDLAGAEGSCGALGTEVEEDGKLEEWSSVQNP